MIGNLSENCISADNTIKPAECTENSSATCQDDRAESKDDVDTSEETVQTKKRFRSEKQRERTRQYKKKIRRAKKQMMREKKLAEKNSSSSHVIDDRWPNKQQGQETSSSSARLLQISGTKRDLKSIGDNKTTLIENPTENVFLQVIPALNLTREAEVVVERYEDNLFDINTNDDSLSIKRHAPLTVCCTAQTEETIESDNIEVDKTPSKENLAVILSPIIYLTTQVAADVDKHDNIIPDNNTKGDSVSLKRQEPNTECGIDPLLSQTGEETESGVTGVDKSLSQEKFAEQISVQSRSTINHTTEAVVDEPRLTDSTLDDNMEDRKDIFGILSVYLDSSIHYNYVKDSVVMTSPANDFEYVYFSMKDFWK